MPQKIDISQAKCTKLSFESSVQFLRDENTETKDLTGFDIEAYTGAVVDRYWGKLVIAVDGIKAAKQMPIFLNHNAAKIVGYSTSHKTDKSFSVQGVFSAVTEAATEVKGLAAEGFPWQASIGVTPLTVLEVNEKSSVVVNGKQVNGPAEVWLESEVFETSFVPLGADGNTRVTVFEKEQRAVKPTTIPPQEQNMDLEQLKKDHPELVVALTAEIVVGLGKEQLEQHNKQLVDALLATGAQAERDRIADVRAQSLPGHEALIAQLEMDGKSTGADAAKSIIAAEHQLRKQAGEQLQSNPVVPSVDGGQQGKATIKRAEFDKLSDQQRRAHLSAGAVIVE